MNHHGWKGRAHLNAGLAALAAAVAGCESSRTASSDDLANYRVEIEHAAINHTLAALRRTYPTARIGFDPRVATWRELGEARDSIHTAQLIGVTGIVLLPWDDPVACEPLPQTQVCGFNVVDAIVALGKTSRKGERVVIDVFLFEPSPNGPFPLTMGITTLTFAQEKGVWRIIDEQASAS